MRNNRNEEKLRRKQRISTEEVSNCEDKETEVSNDGINSGILNGNVSKPPKPTMAVLTPIHCTNIEETKKEDRSTINLSEFESYSTNPFEEMELKTLNDKEELAMLLQPNQRNFGLPYQNFNSAWGVGVPETYSPVQHCPSNWTPVSNQTIQAGMEKLVLSNNPSTFSSGSLRQAKSVPDLSETGSQTNPPATVSSVEKRLNSKTPPPRLVSDRMQIPNLQSFANPGDHLVEQLHDMGFSRERAVKAVIRLGPNEKNVVDQLLLIQKFEELGYSLLQIESALEILKPGTEMYQRLEEHLQLTRQLLALGFAQDRINSALIATGYDRDKALDMLLVP